MSPRTSEQFEEIREEKKTLIMETALDLFATQGFYSTSIQDIAKKAGISKGLLYNYFDSKEELMRSIIMKGLDDILVFFDPDHDGILTQKEIQYFIGETFRIMQENVDFWKLYIAIITQPPVLKLADKKFSEVSGRLWGMIEAYFQQQGDPDPKVSARIFVSLLDGIGMHYIMDPENFPLESVKQRLLDFYTI
jgi:AcrR family transcriptional regulator